MACGKPVVAVRGGGTPEIVQDRVNGLLVPPRDSEELAHVIMLLLKDRELARRMGMAGRERVMRDFTIERLVREVEEVYFSLLGSVA
jgi:glycosyltransferase involved in cell wall biosynthesis